MFIGGSPVGTAGGVKTVTIAVIFAASVSAIKGKNEVNLFSRNVRKEAVSKAKAIENPCNVIFQDRPTGAVLFFVKKNR